MFEFATRTSVRIRLKAEDQSTPPNEIATAAATVTFSPKTVLAWPAQIYINEIPPGQTHAMEEAIPKNALLPLIRLGVQRPFRLSDLDTEGRKPKGRHS